MFRFCIPSEKISGTRLKSKCFALGQYLQQQWQADIAGIYRPAVSFFSKTFSTSVLTKN
jgi:hypothetical protein